MSESCGKMRTWTPLSGKPKNAHISSRSLPQRPLFRLAYGEPPSPEGEGLGPPYSVKSKSFQKAFMARWQAAGST